MQSHNIKDPDVILIGSGIMSATLGAMLKWLEPKLKIQLYEVTEELTQESSHGWNNAGTGHAGLCELSYTPIRKADGTVNVSKAIEMFEQFERSKQFWSFAVESGMAGNPREFINQVPHISFVQGPEQVEFLKARHESMAAHHFFREMDYTTDRATIWNWAPLLVEGRGSLPFAATKMDGGTDVNFGVISRKLLSWLSQQDSCGVATDHRVVGLESMHDSWVVSFRDFSTREIRRNRSRFVFIGAGGGSLRLLQKSGIPESRGIGGFPISGKWLVCTNPEIVKRHEAKVYGQAHVTAPTMAVPHLDTRVLDGRKTLLFGPFAAGTTRFLHGKGSWMDLFSSVRTDNIATLLKIGVHNLPLISYLIQQSTQSMVDRMKVLQTFYPEARVDDWKLVDAGIRVQAIKKTDGEAGIVHYGTEIIINSNRSLSALLGASPGASVSVNIALDVIKHCLPQLLATNEGTVRLKAMIPTYDEDTKLPENAKRFREVQGNTNKILRLVRS